MREGVQADSIMVYMLVGYDKRETAAKRDYRRAVLRNLGCRPYPMPFVRTPELVGFQRFVVGASVGETRRDAGLCLEGPFDTRHV